MSSETNDTKRDGTPPPEKPVRHRLVRAMEAAVVAIPVALALAYAMPGFRMWNSDVVADVPAQTTLEAGDLETILDNADRQATHAEERPEFEETYGSTYRICRYRGTEWEVVLRSVNQSPADAMEELKLDSAPGLVPLAEKTEYSALLPGLVNLGTSFGGNQNLPDAERMLSGVAQGEGEMRMFAAGETENGPPLVVAMAWPLNPTRTVSIKMRLLNPDSLSNLLSPPDSEMLRALLSKRLGVPGTSLVMDSIENELSDMVVTNYFVQNDMPESEVAKFYEQEVSGIETMKRFEGEPMVLQVIKEGPITLYLSHLPGEVPDTSLTIVKIWKKKNVLQQL